MKKFFTLIAALVAMSSVNAQNAPSKIGMTDPVLVQQFYDEYIMTFGVSADGRYIWGLVGGGDPTANILDIRNESEIISLPPARNENGYGVSVAGISYDGVAFVQDDELGYLYNIKDGTKTLFNSPVEGLGVEVWDVTADGKYFAANLTDSLSIQCEPMYAELQEDGTYKYTMLPYDKMDAKGAYAQYTQARFISDNGKYVMGAQIESRGISNRIVIWEKQEDGSFKLTTPLDDLVYNMDYPKIGDYPEFKDYVTADKETEPELWQEQHDNFYKLIEEYERKYSEFTKDGYIETYGMRRAQRSNCFYASLVKEITDENDENYGMELKYPIVYNCDTKQYTVNYDVNGLGFEELPGGGYIVSDNSTGLYSSNVVKKDGTVQELTEWLKDVTGTDISEYFSISLPSFTGEVFEGVFAGLPYFSNDGKTLVLSSFDEEFCFITAVLDFDRDIFAETATGISKVNVVNKVAFKNGIISLDDNKSGMAEVYSMNGEKQCDLAIDGSVNLNGVVAPGSYIVKVKSNGKDTVMKVIVK